MTTRDEVLRQFTDDSENARRQRALIEGLLRDHEEERHQLFALFDEAPVFMTFLEGPDLRVAKVNRRIRDATDAETLIGKTARELGEVVGGDDRILAILERVYTSGKAETVHTMHEAGMYAMRCFARTFVPIRDVGGSVRGVLNLTVEITDEVRERAAREEIDQLHQAELQRMFALFEEAPVIISVVEYPDWRISMANRLSRQLMGGRSLVGTRLGDAVGADNPTLAAIKRVHASGRSETFETTAETSGIAGRTFSNTLVPIRDPNGATGRVMAFAVETTEQRQAREALERQARDLELARTEAVEADHAKDQFLAMLGHELRNPLAPMLTAVQVLGMEGTISPALDLIERQVRHLTRLVDDLLDVSRIARGMVVLNRRDIGIETVVRRALEIANPLLVERGHRVMTDLVHRDLGVSADLDRLAQVVANLITNAAKYSEPESQIRIVGSRKGDRVMLSVSDDGIGIAPEMIERIFEPFVQQPQTLERSHGGLGLGLSIVKNLVEAHGGTVSVRSDGRGRGSTFVIELPGIELRRAPADRSRHAVAKRRQLSRVPTRPLRILVVDDNREAADILKIALGAVGHSIALAYDGPSALEIAKTHAPEIALVDLGLPVMNGYRLAELLRATSDIPVVAVTGYGQQCDRQRTQAAGFASHLVKPVDFDELSELVSRLCEVRHGS